MGGLITSFNIYISLVIFLTQRQSYIIACYSAVSDQYVNVKMSHTHTHTDTDTEFDMFTHISYYTHTNRYTFTQTHTPAAALRVGPSEHSPAGAEYHS